MEQKRWREEREWRHRRKRGPGVSKDRAWREREREMRRFEERQRAGERERERREMRRFFRVLTGVKKYRRASTVVLKSNGR